MRRSAVAAAALVTLAFAAPAAHAGQKVHQKTKIVGYSSVATWEYTEGNIITLVNVVVTENDLSGTAGPGTDAFVSLNIIRADIDTGNVLLAGRAEVNGPENFTFTIDRQLNTANLQVSNAIFQDDNSFTFFNVDLNLSWTATAAAEDLKFNEKIKEPG